MHNNSRSLTQPEEQIYFPHIPKALQLEICHRLSSADRKHLAMTCSYFSTFIRENYLKTTYGKMFNFFEFADKRLTQTINNIEHLKYQNQFGFFSKSLRSRSNNECIMVSALISLLICVAGCALIEHLSYSRWFFIIPLILPLLIVRAAVRAWMAIPEANEALLNATTDLTTRAAILRLLTANPLLSVLIDQSEGYLFRDSSTTHKEEYQILDAAKITMEGALKAIKQYHNNIKVKSPDEIDLSLVSDNKKSVDILAELLDQYNEQNNENNTLTFRR